jgi:hypothetical protein
VELIQLSDTVLCSNVSAIKSFPLESKLALNNFDEIFNRYNALPVPRHTGVLVADLLQINSLSVYLGCHLLYESIVELLKSQWLGEVEIVVNHIGR